jgi:hypothetical protein
MSSLQNPSEMNMHVVRALSAGLSRLVVAFVVLATLAFVLSVLGPVVMGGAAVAGVLLVADAITDRSRS